VKRRAEEKEKIRLIDGRVLVNVACGMQVIPSRNENRGGAHRSGGSGEYVRQGRDALRTDAGRGLARKFDAGFKRK